MSANPNHCLRVLDSIAEVPAADWDRLFPGQLEGWDYYRAIEEAALPGFRWRYFTLWQDQLLIAAAPAFETAYRLDTTVSGWLKAWTERLTRAMPRLLTLDLLCLGSPVTEACHVGFDPQTDERQRLDMMGALLAGAEAHAAATRIGLIGIKDAAEGSILARFCGQGGYTRMPGMPTAILPLEFADERAYLASLSRATRKDIKRKLRARERLRVERRSDIADVLDRVMALYDDTWSRSALKLEHLTPAYFTGVLARMNGRASCFLYWCGDQLVAFNLVLHDQSHMIDKFLGIDHARTRELNLYHVSWMDDVRFCLGAKIGFYQSGQAFYGEKVRLGSRLDVNWQFFRHRSPIINAALRAVASVVRLDRFDPEIRTLMSRAK